MNNKLVSTLATLALASATMACASETTPEQQEGVTDPKKASSGEANPETKPTDENATPTADKKDLKEQLTCEGFAKEQGLDPSCCYWWCY